MLHTCLLLVSPLCTDVPTPHSIDGSLAFQAGRQAATDNGQVLLVLAHGSDWNALGERLFEGFWTQAEFASSADCVLADIDVLQAPNAEVKKANDARNEGWVEKGSGLQTYPAILAYAPDGTVIGSRQGTDLPRKMAEAREAALQFASDCRKWMELTAVATKARTDADPALELTLLIQRDELPLGRHSKLLEDIRRLDPDDANGHHARLSLPHWNTLVQQATSEAQAGKGEEAEQRLLGLLSNTAYTREQRAALHLALGSVYRRWAEHDELAARHMRSASTLAPDSVCGRAGMQLYLRLYAGPSLSLGWANRHTGSGATEWLVEDLPPELEAGVWSLRIHRSHGGNTVFSGAALCVDGMPIVLGSGEAALTGKEDLVDMEFTLDKRLSGATLRIILGDHGTSRGTLTWIRLR